jgi:hypothetical protein
MRERFAFAFHELAPFDLPGFGLIVLEPQSVPLFDPFGRL